MLMLKPFTVSLVDDVEDVNVSVAADLDVDDGVDAVGGDEVDVEGSRVHTVGNINVIVFPDVDVDDADVDDVVRVADDVHVDTMLMSTFC